MSNDLIRELLDLLPPAPEPNCHCHLSPPCNDCVDWAHQREVVAQAEAMLAPPPAAAVQPVGLESAWQAFAAKLELNMEEPSARAKSHGVASRYVYAHTVALWEAFTAALANTPTQQAQGEAVGDVMLPAALGPYSHEWYRLCERAPHATKISISGELAQAIVEATRIAAPPQQAQVAGGAEAVGVSDSIKESMTRIVMGDYQLVYDSEFPAATSCEFVPRGSYFMGDGLGGETVEDCFRVSYEGKTYFFPIRAASASAPAPKPAAVVLSDAWQPLNTAPEELPVWARGWDWGKVDGKRHYGFAYMQDGEWWWTNSGQGKATYLTDWMHTMPSRAAITGAKPEQPMERKLFTCEGCGSGPWEVEWFPNKTKQGNRYCPNCTGAD